MANFVLYFTPEGSMPPGTVYATLDSRAGGATPAESVSVLDFDPTTVEYADWKLRLPSNYAGGGLTLTIDWSATSATSGAVQWEAAFRAMPLDAEDIDAAFTYDFNTVSTTTASASGEIVRSTITFSNGVDMDSLAAGETGIVRVRRNGAGTDDMAGDAELWNMVIVET